MRGNPKRVITYSDTDDEQQIAFAKHRQTHPLYAWRRKIVNANEWEQEQGDWNRSDRFRAPIDKVAHLEAFQMGRAGVTDLTGGLFFTIELWRFCHNLIKCNTIVIKVKCKFLYYIVI